MRTQGRFYRQSLVRFDVHRTDGAFRVEGDSHFAFLVPEPAFEDRDLLDLLVQEGILSQRFAACLLMVDFSNAIFSPRRAALLPTFRSRGGRQPRDGIRGRRHRRRRRGGVRRKRIPGQLGFGAGRLERGIRAADRRLFHRPRSPRPRPPKDSAP